MMRLDRGQAGPSRPRRKAASQPCPEEKVEPSWKTYDDLNRATIEAVVTADAKKDQEATDRIGTAAEAVRQNPGMAYSSVRRAKEWHEMQADKLPPQTSRRDAFASFQGKAGKSQKRPKFGLKMAIKYLKINFFKISSVKV